MGYRWKTGAMTDAASTPASASPSLRSGALADDAVAGEILRDDDAYTDSLIDFVTAPGTH